MRRLDSLLEVRNQASKHILGCLRNFLFNVLLNCLLIGGSKVLDHVHLWRGDVIYFKVRHALVAKVHFVAQIALVILLMLLKQIVHVHRLRSKAGRWL